MPETRRGGARARRPLRVTPTRQAAAAISAALRDGALLDAAMERHADALDPRDRRWLQELIYGSLRRRAELDEWLAPRVRGGIARVDADLVDLLRHGVYQLLCMGSVPPYAAIGETVELAKTRHGIGAGQLVNAVLRRIDRERDLPLPLPEDPNDALAITMSQPRWLVDRWVRAIGMDDARARLDAARHEAPIVLRPFGVSAEVLEEELSREGVHVTRHPLVADSLVLPLGTPLLTLDAFTGGRCFVQDPAATLVAHYVAPPADGVVVDLCAAPGGKALELSQHTARVIAADRSPVRVDRLLVGLGRVATDRIHAIVCDAREPAIARADVVLLDVPCTGTGTLRRHPDARWRLRVADIAVMAAVQREILDGAAAAVAPGGLLVYSTCSLEPEENDEQIDAFLARHPEFRLEPPPGSVVPMTTLDAGRLRVRPEHHGADGAFAARLRRAR
ncbi:MAG: 16S rRNA (cytosine(967)-C(5))-methyltransferase RsmB [Gemmatimonadaceae bacterium]|jgi:16S rRNA (cytosine967-C5)-methyltransferase|nr:16S rRNA (cytosine(967)-C(5))-methyltransferase RsmB [Gemmatimonadaceae bacterium]